MLWGKWWSPYSSLCSIKWDQHDGSCALKALRCIMNWMFVTHQYWYAEILTPHVHGTVLRGRAFWEMVNHVDRAFRKGMSALIKETPGSFLTPSTMRRHNQKTAVNEPGNGLSRNLPVHWSWTSQITKLREINVWCLSHSVYSIFAIVSWTKTTSEIWTKVKTQLINICGIQWKQCSEINL